MCSIPNFSFKNPLMLSLSAHWCIWLMFRSPHMLPSTTMLIASGILQKYPLYSRLVSTFSKYSIIFSFSHTLIIALFSSFCKIDFRASFQKAIDRTGFMCYTKSRIWERLPHGEVSEWFKEPVLKTGDSQEPWVRIPPSPPFLYRFLCIRLWRSTQVAEGAPLLRE